MTKSILQRWSRASKFAAATAALALAATSATAAIVATAGAAVQIAPPPSVELNQLQSNVNLFAFNERQCFWLNVPLQTDQGAIPAFTKMSSHFVSGDPNTTLLLTGRVRFDAQIIGVISTTAGLDASDASCGAPGTVYPTGVEPNRGFEPSPPQADSYQIIAGGFGIQVTMDVPPLSFSDHLRVLTRCECDGDVCGGD